MTELIVDMLVHHRVNKYIVQIVQVLTRVYITCARGLENISSLVSKHPTTKNPVTLTRNLYTYIYVPVKAQNSWV